MKIGEPGAADVTKQQGFLSLGTLYVLVLTGAAGLLGLKLIPIYLEHYKVSKSLESLKGDSGLVSKSREDIQKLLAKRLDVNMVDRVTNNEIKVEKRGGEVKVTIEYEVVEPLVGNIDMVVKFSDVVEVVSN